MSLRDIIKDKLDLLNEDRMHDSVSGDLESGNHSLGNMQNIPNELIIKTSLSFKIFSSPVII